LFRSGALRAVAGPVPGCRMARRGGSGVWPVGARDARLLDLEASDGAAHLLGAHSREAAGGRRRVVTRESCDTAGASSTKKSPTGVGLAKLERRGFLKPRRMYEVLTLPFAFPALGHDVKQSLSNPPERLVGSKMWSLR